MAKIDQLPTFELFELNVLLKHFGIEEYDSYARLTPKEKAEVDADVACSEDSE